MQVVVKLKILENYFYPHLCPAKHLDLGVCITVSMWIVTLIPIKRVARRAWRTLWTHSVAHDRYNNAMCPILLTVYHKSEIKGCVQEENGIFLLRQVGMAAAIRLLTFHCALDRNLKCTCTSLYSVHGTWPAFAFLQTTTSRGQD